MHELTEPQRITMENWDPERRAVHCSNCLNCKVVEREGDLFVKCAKGHGKVPHRTYWALMRRQHPLNFVNPKECPDWSSMDD